MKTQDAVISLARANIMTVGKLARSQGIGVTQLHKGIRDAFFFQHVIVAAAAFNPADAVGALGLYDEEEGLHAFALGFELRYGDSRVVHAVRNYIESRNTY